ncbi:MAG: ABC transporter permease [Chloroflexi bacterium]|nr:ABC transporter permease [Chloroflexota bacterium]
MKFKEFAQRLLTGLLQASNQMVLPLAAIVGSLAIGALLMAVIGINPFWAYGYLWSGIVGNPYQVGNVLVKTTPLLLTGLGLGLAFRSGVFNIGGEGQIYMGALAGTAVAIRDWGLPPVLHISLALLAAFIGGGLWAALPGFLKGRYQVNEVISTILLNYIAIFIVGYFTRGPMRDNPGAAAALPHTPEVLSSASLPVIWQGTKLHAGFVIALVAAVLMYVLIYHTPLGFKARTVGYSPEAARYAGMKVIPLIVMVMFISGGLAGIAGASEIMGVQRRLRGEFSPGWGYTSIAIALLGRNHPLGIILAAILFGALEVGVRNMEALAGVPVTIASVIQALTIFFVAMGAVNPKGLRAWFSRREQKSHE